MLLKDKIGREIQIYAPNKFSSISLTANTAYDMVFNAQQKPDIVQYECSEDIQISLNDSVFGLPKKVNTFGISNEINKISFVSQNDTTLYLSWQV